MRDKRKWSAQDYFNRIPDGHQHAIVRPADEYTDRALREMIRKENTNGDCIISVGNAIYRPIHSDPVDCADFNKYIAQEKSRVKKERLKIESMQQAFLSRMEAGRWTAEQKENEWS